MIEFWRNNNKVIMFILVLALLGVNGFTAGKAIFPNASNISKEIMRDLVREVVSEEIKPLENSFMGVETKVDILYFNAADEWVRLIDKQYDKLTKNAPNLYWIDVEYVLSKWVIMPDDYKKPGITARMAYIRTRYDSHIRSGDNI